MSDAALKFAEARDEITSRPIAPEGQTDLGLMSTFTGAAQQLGVQQLSVQPEAPALNDNDKTLMRAQDVGVSLTEKMSGVKCASSSLLGEFGSQAAKLGRESLDAVMGNQSPDNKAPAFTQNLNANLQLRPAAGSGFGGVG